MIIFVIYFFPKSLTVRWDLTCTFSLVNFLTLFTKTSIFLYEKFSSILIDTANIKAIRIHVCIMKFYRLCLNTITSFNYKLFNNNVKLHYTSLSEQEWGKINDNYVTIQ